MQVQLHERRQGGVVILAPEGRLDSGKIDQFDKVVQARIREGHHRLLIDCTNLVFAASSALRVLLVTVRKLNEVGGKLVLCNMNPHNPRDLRDQRIHQADEHPRHLRRRIPPR